MNADTMLININGKKLRVLLNSFCAENGTNIYDLSRTAGYSQSWLYDICKSGRIRKAGITFLKNNCGIDYNQYSSDGERVPNDTTKYTTHRKHKDAIDIDGKKLESLLNEYFDANGGSIYDLSMEFGFSRKWLYDAIVTNRLKKVGINLIKYKCNIELEDYLPQPEPEPVVEEKPAETNDISNEFSEQDLKFMNEFFGKMDRIADTLERLVDIQQRNAETLEDLRSMLK